MATRTATLIIRFKADDGGWKRAEIATGARGRIRFGYALINERAVKVSDRPHNYQVR